MLITAQLVFLQIKYYVQLSGLNCGRHISLCLLVRLKISIRVKSIVVVVVQEFNTEANTLKADSFLEKNTIK